MKKMSRLEILELITIFILFGVIIVITSNGAIKETNISNDASNYLSNNDKKYIAKYIENEITGCDLTEAVNSLTDSTDNNNLFLDMYPVGSIYTSVNSVNPGTIFGGTWIEYGAGRTLVGVDTTQTEFDTVEKTGGEKTHTLTVSEIPSHSHSGIHWSTPTGKEWSDVNTGSSKDGYGLTVSASKISTTSWVTGNTGGGAAHNNLQPYITVYMWKRTA